MKIGIIGEIYYNVKIEYEGDCDNFNLFETNHGYATTSVESPSLDLAKNLSQDNNVLFFTDYDYPPFVRELKKYRINTDYITPGNGLGVTVSFTGIERNNGVRVYPSVSETLTQIKFWEESIFDGLDVMVTTVFDENLIHLCKKHRVQLFLFEVDEEFDYLDEEDYELIRGIDRINLDNAMQVIREWDK